MDVIHLRCFSSKINFIFLPALAFASVVSGFYSRRAFSKRGIRSDFGKVVGGRDRRGDKVAGEILLSRLLKQSKN